MLLFAEPAGDAVNVRSLVVLGDSVVFGCLTDGIGQASIFPKTVTAQVVSHVAGGCIIHVRFFVHFGFVFVFHLLYMQRGDTSEELVAEEQAHIASTGVDDKNHVEGDFDLLQEVEHRPARQHLAPLRCMLRMAQVQVFENGLLEAVFCQRIAQCPQYFADISAQIGLWDIDAIGYPLRNDTRIVEEIPLVQHTALRIAVHGCQVVFRFGVCLFVRAVVTRSRYRFLHVQE